MSAPFDSEEIVSLVEETTGSRSSSRKAAGGGSISTSRSPFRSCWLIVMASLAVMMVVAFFTDAIEININLGAFDTENKVQSNSTSPKMLKGKNRTKSKSTSKSKTSSASKDPPPLVHSPPVQEPGYKANPAQLSDTYLPRGKPINATDKEALAQKHGTWTLIDPKADQRPRYDFYSRYPSRDIPRDQFPAKAWQIDREYLAKFLPEAKALIERSMEAMLAEYGHSAEEEPGKTFEERAAMFNVSVIDISNIGTTKNFKNAGWMTERASDGLIRRLLHAVMTEDTFTVVMGGHSAAAGHGNIFQQSYTMQLQKVLEPIFARLSVKHTAHNMGMGGLGTIQNGLAAGDLYGKDVDILIWDSGMTEKSPIPQDTMMRQGLIAGDRVPIIAGVNGAILKYLDQHADADVATLGSGNAGHDGIPKTLNEIQAQSLPWAARYLICEGNNLCRHYDGMCWIDRPDFTPTTKQNAAPGGRASWHPGNLSHQLHGRVQSFPILKALHEAITMWAAAPDYALPDAAWHVTDYYENIRSKVMSLNSTLGFCHDSSLPDRVCDVPMNGRSEYLPRRNPGSTSIRSILKYPEQIEAPAMNAYDPPNVRLPFLEEPCGEVDYLNIVENGVDFVPNMARIQTAASQGRRMMNNEQIGDRKLANPAIVPGLGWTLNTHSAPHLCDGSYDSFCGKEKENNCLLYGHNDNRGGIFFDSYSGWLIVNLANLKHGLLVLRLESWHEAGRAKRTEGWECENNACDPSQRRLESTLQAPNSTAVETRRLAKVPFCDAYKFEFIIDGQMNSWNGTETLSHKQGEDHFFTLLDDPDFMKGESRDVELAIRSTGCGRTKTLQLTHIYWA
jgi:hypothetical protein